jgi:hypothetical protein
LPPWLTFGVALVAGLAAGVPIGAAWSLAGRELRAPVCKTCRWMTAVKALARQASMLEALAEDPAQHEDDEESADEVPF